MAPVESFQIDKGLAQRHRGPKGARTRLSAYERGLRRCSQTNGAILALTELTAAPDYFELDIDGDNERRMASVRWRTLTALGVAFDA
jgi:hypothetical protein